MANQITAIRRTTPFSPWERSISLRGNRVHFTLVDNGPMAPIITTFTETNDLVRALRAHSLENGKAEVLVYGTDGTDMGGSPLHMFMLLVESKNAY